MMEDKYKETLQALKQGQRGERDGTSKKETKASKVGEEKAITLPPHAGKTRGKIKGL